MNIISPRRKKRIKYRRKRYKRRTKSSSFKTYLFVFALILIVGGFFLKGTVSDLLSRKQPKPSPEPKEYSIPIFMYHYIEYVEDKNDTIRIGLNIEPEEFERQMRYLKSNGYYSISFSEFLKIIESGEDSPKKAFVITFDDGYESFYLNAFPILKKYNLKAMSSIVLNTLNFEDHLKDWQIKEMSQSGLVEFGAHSVSHVNLEDVSSEKLEREVVDSKDILEHQLGISIESFVYPAGHYNEEVLEEVKRAGYKAALSIEGNYPHTLDDLFKLSRVRANTLKPEGLVSFFNN